MLYLEKDSYVLFLQGFLPVFLSDLINSYASVKAGFALDNGGKANVGEREIILTKLRVASSSL